MASLNDIDVMRHLQLGSWIKNEYRPMEWMAIRRSHVQEILT